MDNSHNGAAGTRRERRPARALLVSLLALMALAAACGDDDDSDPDETATDTSAPPEEDAGAPATVTDTSAPADEDAGAAAAPTGEPIKLGSVLTIQNPAWSNENVRLVNEAWADYVNEELGGINGRPLEVISCDDEGDPGKTVQCVQDLIDDGVIAFVNNSSLAFGANALPIMEAEGLPNIGGWPVSPPEYNSELNYPTTPGASGSYPSLATYLASQGAKSLALVFTDTPSGQGVNDSIQQLWDDLGGEKYVGVSFDPTAADFVPTLTRVKDVNPDGVIFAVGEGAAGRMFQAAQVVGLDATLAATATAATQAVFDSAGDAVDGVLFAMAVLPPDLEANDDVEKYRDVMEQFAPDVELTNQSGVAASSMQYAVDVLSTIEGEITPAAIVKALQTPPVAPFLTHSMSPELAPASLPQVWNPYNLVVEYSDGALVPVGDDAEEGDRVSKEAGVTWFTGFVPGDAG